MSWLLIDCLSHTWTFTDDICTKSSKRRKTRQEPQKKINVWFDLIFIELAERLEPYTSWRWLPSCRSQIFVKIHTPRKRFVVQWVCPGWVPHYQYSMNRRYSQSSRCFVTDEYNFWLETFEELKSQPFQYAGGDMGTGLLTHNLCSPLPFGSYHLFRRNCFHFVLLSTQTTKLSHIL